MSPFSLLVALLAPLATHGLFIIGSDFCGDSLDSMEGCLLSSTQPEAYSCESCLKLSGAPWNCVGVDDKMNACNCSNIVNCTQNMEEYLSCRARCNQEADFTNRANSRKCQASLDSMVACEASSYDELKTEANPDGQLTLASCADCLAYSVAPQTCADALAAIDRCKSDCEACLVSIESFYSCLFDDCDDDAIDGFEGCETESTGFFNCAMGMSQDEFTSCDACISALPSGDDEDVPETCEEVRVFFDQNCDCGRCDDSLRAVFECAALQEGIDCDLRSSVGTLKILVLLQSSLAVVLVHALFV